MSKFVMTVIALLLFALGFWLGRDTAHPWYARAMEARPLDSPALRVEVEQDGVRAVLRDRDAYSRIGRLSVLLSSLGPEAVPEVADVLEDTRLIKIGHPETVLLVRFYASHDPENATQWAFVRAPTPYRHACVEVALEEWAKVDLEAAKTRALMATSADAGVPEAALVGLVRGWFDSGQPGLDAFMVKLAMGVEQQRVMDVLAREVIRRDGPTVAIAWAESLPDEPYLYKNVAFMRVGSELAKIDRATAKSWCEKHCYTKMGEGLMDSIAARMARIDPPATMQWLSETRPGEPRDAAVRAVFRVWRLHDPKGLAAYFEQMDPATIESWLRPAAGLYGMSISWDEPVRAYDWIGLIEDEERRERAYITVTRRWRRHDEEAAYAWLDQSTLSEEAREKVRKPLTPELRLKQPTIAAPQ